MPAKLDQDASPSVKLLRIFRKLLLNGQRHYQGDLASEFQCSPQTIIRIMADIESVIGMNLETGTDNRRKWYRIKSKSPLGINMEYEELRYLSVCRDLAAQTLPAQILSRVDDTIFNLSLHMSELGRSGDARAPRLHFFSKGRIDYSPYFGIIENLISAIDKNLGCKISYKAVGKKAAREHLYAPHCLVSMNQAIYVLGAIIREDGLRFTNFAVHRIRGCTVLDEKFDIEFPDASGNMFGLPWHEPRTFRIHFNAGGAAEYVGERIWSDDQKLLPREDGSLVLEITTRSEEELMAWVRSFGEEAKLLE